MCGANSKAFENLFKQNKLASFCRQQTARSCYNINKNIINDNINNKFDNKNNNDDKKNSKNKINLTGFVLLKAYLMREAFL